MCLFKQEFLDDPRIFLIMNQRVFGNTAVYGVFGDPVAHSLSPLMHNAAFAELGLNCIYIPFHVKLTELSVAMQGLRVLGIQGVNLTIPHKQAVIPELDEVVGDSLVSGSVNTVKLQDGRLLGTSTDGSGFLQSLREEGNFDPMAKAVLLFGAGGSAAAIVYRLIQAGIASLTVVNRDRARLGELQEAVKAKTDFLIETVPLRQLEQLDWQRFQLIINTTSVGLHEDISLIPQQHLQPDHFVYDLVYRKGETRLIRDAAQVGCRHLSGLSLLLYQGAHSFAWWLGKEPPLVAMRAALHK